MSSHHWSLPSIFHLGLSPDTPHDDVFLNQKLQIKFIYATINYTEFIIFCYLHILRTKFKYKKKELINNGLALFYLRMDDLSPNHSIHFRKLITLL